MKIVRFKSFLFVKKEDKKNKVVDKIQKNLKYPQKEGIVPQNIGYDYK